MPARSQQSTRNNGRETPSNRHPFGCHRCRLPLPPPLIHSSTRRGCPSKNRDDNLRLPTVLRICLENGAVHRGPELVHFLQRVQANSRFQSLLRHVAASSSPRWREHRRADRRLLVDCIQLARLLHLTDFPGVLFDLLHRLVDHKNTPGRSGQISAPADELPLLNCWQDLDDRGKVQGRNGVLDAIFQVALGTAAENELDAMLQARVEIAAGASLLVQLVEQVATGQQGVGGIGGLGDACGELYQPRALQAVEAGVHFDEDGAAGGEHHLSVARPILQADAIQHLEDVIDERVLLLARGIQELVLAADDSPLVPGKAFSLGVDPHRNTKVLPLIGDCIDDVLVAYKELLQRQLLVGLACRI
mmetsp:Transcript_121812/g.389510  ORF Transcript_121812/g.389510 Transcript_121812/m.389510 type:complete len:361 (+) Transcript_121812:47-1129(+)